MKSNKTDRMLGLAACVLAFSGLTSISKMTAKALLMDATFTDTTCTVDGIVFNDGDIIVGFETRCGTVDEFPCFCDTAAGQAGKAPITCPYCSFALKEQNELLCLKEGDSDAFVDISGFSQNCGCKKDLNTNEMIPDCIEIGQNQVSFSQQSSSDTCTIDLPGRDTKTFVRGEPLDDFLPDNRCGSNFPCFCNPDVPGGIECPYCRFPIEGGDLLCAGDGDRVSFIDMDGISQSCTCEIPSEPGAEPTTSCNSDDREIGLGDNDKPTDNSSSNGVCSIELESGEIVTLQYGEPFGDYIETRCGSSTEFPCFCNPALRNQMECPYCGFVQGNGELLCAKDQEVVTFNDGDEDLTCSCEVPTDPSDEPIQRCGDEMDSPIDNDTPVNDEDEDFLGNNDSSNKSPCKIADLNGDIVMIEHGETFGELVEGVCGDYNEWPAYCNTELDPTVVTRAASQDFESIEYPYCVYTDTSTGEATCARNNEQINYVNDRGEEIECLCMYSSPGLGGAQSTCTPVNASPQSSPSSPTNLRPTFPPMPSTSSMPANTSTAIASLLLMLTMLIFS